MKRIITYTIIFMLSIMLFFQHTVYATGDITINKTSLNIINGETDTFKITATNAVGRVDIESSNTDVITVSTESEWLEENSVDVIVTAVSVGTAQITVTLTDASTNDEEDLSSKSYTINVTVTEENSDDTDDLDDIDTSEIDITPPTITGVEDGEIYSDSVTIDAQDESGIDESSVLLKKDGEVVEGFKLGDTISENGTYELTVSDINGNTTTVTFEIAIDNTSEDNNDDNNNTDTSINDNDDDNTKNVVDNTNKGKTNTNSSNASKNDSSTAKTVLPYTGKRTIAIVIIIIAIIGTVMYKKYKKYSSF